MITWLDIIRFINFVIMKLCIRHIITLIIASLISFTANADMSHIASRFSDGHIVDYQYDAAGKRLGAYYLLASDDVFNDGIGVEGGGVSIQELVREWSGEFVYENGELERILTDNGYWKNGRYWFYIKDWQGNNRVTVGGISDASATSSGGMLNNPTLLQAKDVNVYYPYGTRFSDVFATTTDRYQYSGKEFDRMNGLDLYDFHARQYDPVLGRFTTPDPLSEKYYHISPYAYCASNPLRYIDPTGKFIDALWDATNVVYDVGSAVYNHIIGNHDEAIGHWVDTATDVAALIIPGVPAGVTKVAKVTDKASDVIKTSKRAKKTQNIKIEISKENKINRNLLNPPHKAGNAPTFKKDGKSVEIHHEGQNPNGPYREMHPNDHRGKGNYKKNHPKNNKSEINREQFNNARKEYWKNEYPEKQTK